MLPESCVLITEYHDLTERVALIQGKDADDANSPNGQIEFEISKASFEGTQNPKDIFVLKQTDAWTAEIFASTPLRNKYGNYTLIITARDLGQTSNRVTNTLNICVSDFNDHSPVFINPLHNTTLRIPENMTIGQLILQVMATDEDIGVNALVRYRLKPDPLGSYKLFNLDADNGMLTLKLPLNREKQKLHELRIEAYDQGLPTSLSTNLDLNIYIRNVNEYEPQFIVEDIAVNFTEHAVPGTERVKLPDTINMDELTELDDPPAEICYFIVKGNEKHLFKLDATSHILTTAKEIDREVHAKFDLFVQATENCHEHQYAKNDLDLTKDSSVVRVRVRIIDINDNPPKFRSKIFTGGITTNVDYGTIFMRIEAYDADEQENAKINYYRIGEIRQTLSEGLEYLENPFLIDRNTGEVQLNFDPQKDMKGYFDFMVAANDSFGMSDMAHVFIYLLREDQKIRFVFRLQPQELRERVHTFRETLSNITGCIVNIDEIKVHVNSDGSVDKTKTDLYMHLVKKKDNSIYDVSEVLHVIDANIEDLDDLFKDLNVLDTQPAEAQLLTARPPNGPVFVWLIFTNIFLGTLLLVTISLCASQRKNYKNQLRVAKIDIFRRSSLAHVENSELTVPVPNTNKHCKQGSNPIWLKSCNNEWLKTDDNQSIDGNGDHDSLDDNFLAAGTQDLNETLKGTAKLFNQTNDLNRHFNVYNQIDKLTNNAHIIAKRLETTEL